jgi:hypothetical protein
MGTQASRSGSGALVGRADDARFAAAGSAAAYIGSKRWLGFAARA